MDLDGVGTEFLLMACPSAGLGAVVTGDCDDSDPTTVDDMVPGIPQGQKCHDALENE